MRATPEQRRRDQLARTVLTYDVVLSAMDPNGGVLKYGDIVERLEAITKIDGYTLYSNVDRVLQRMKRSGRVELIKGAGSGWRIRKEQGEVLREALPSFGEPVKKSHAQIKREIDEILQGPDPRRVRRT